MLNSDYRLKPGEPYLNPLASTSPHPEEGLLMNTWMFGVFTINTIIDPEGTDDGGVKAETLARELALKDNPELDIDKLIFRVKQRYLVDCQLLCNAIANGLQEKLDEAFNK
jgi:hypothetical protein